jgi:hypothetical protein
MVSTSEETVTEAIVWGVKGTGWGVVGNGGGEGGGKGGEDGGGVGGGEDAGGGVLEGGSCVGRKRIPDPQPSSNESVIVAPIPERSVLREVGKEEGVLFTKSSRSSFDWVFELCKTCSFVRGQQDCYSEDN